MTLLIFLLLAAILLVVLLIVKSRITRKPVITIPKVKTSSKKNNIIYKSVSIDTLGNFHILTNRGAFLKTSDKMIKHQEIPNSAKLVGYYSKTHEVFYIDLDNRVYFIDENNTNSYTIEQLFTLPREYYPLINSVILNENGNTNIVLSTGKIIEYSHIQEKILDDSKQIKRQFDFAIADPVTLEILVIHGDTYSNYSKNNQKEYLIQPDFHNFFSDSKVIINNFNYRGITGPSDNDSLLSKDTYIEDEIHNYTVPIDGDYTIELYGAGIENGGRGTKIVSKIQLNARDNLKFLIGNSGFRFPCQENKYEQRRGKLPIQASCSGSGASSLLVNNRLSLVAAGAGGWSSGILKCPNNANENISQSRNPATFVIPIKSITVLNPETFEIISITSNNWVRPRYSVKSGNTIEFDEPQTDYTIILNKSISEFMIVTPYSKQKVTDYNYSELNNKLLFEKIYSKDLLTLENNNIPKENTLASAGFSILDSNNYTAMKRVSVSKPRPDYNIAFGGLGGGGFAAEKLTSGISNCGGGGGYTGGNSCVSDLRDDKTNLNNFVIQDNSQENTIDFNGTHSIIPLTCGSAGESYISIEDTIHLPGINRNSGYAIIHPPLPIQEIKEQEQLKKTIEKNTLSGSMDVEKDFPFVEIEIPKESQRINLEVLFYPQDSQPVISVSCHSFDGLNSKHNWINHYTYFQNGASYQSDEINPVKVSIIENDRVKTIVKSLCEYDEINGTSETTGLVYTSNTRIKHTQSFNTLPELKSFYILMKFTGNYKITIT